MTKRSCAGKILLTAGIIFLALVICFPLLLVIAVYDHPLAEIFLPHDYLVYQGSKYYPIGGTLHIDVDYTTNIFGYSTLENSKNVVVFMDGKMPRIKKLYTDYGECRFIWDQDSNENAKRWYIREDIEPDTLLKDGNIDFVKISGHNSNGDFFTKVLTEEETNQLIYLLLDAEVPYGETKYISDRDIKADIYFHFNGFPESISFCVAGLHGNKELIRIVAKEDYGELDWFKLKNDVVDVVDFSQYSWIKEMVDSLSAAN